MTAQDPTSRKEQLLKEHAEWTLKYVEAGRRYTALLPPVRDASKGVEPLPWTPTKESLAEIDSAEKEVNAALAKLHELREQIADC